MVSYKLSAFSDEYSPNFDKQLEGLALHGIEYMEIRGVDGKNISEITEEEAKVLKQKLDKAGIKISAIGSPIGKIGINDPLEPHLALLKHVIKIAKILGTKRIRMFSFYIPKDKNPDDYKEQVMNRLSEMLKIAKEEDILLCHENERGIYGDSAARCLEIQKRFGGEIALVFDHANFICMGDEAYPYAYNLLKQYITYFHIKDALGEEQITPTGEGRGRIPETLADYKKSFDGDVILTLEPHLSNFIGLSKLESTQGDKEIKKSYSSAEEAFAVAVNALKKYI